MENKNIVTIALVGVGAFLLYKFMSKPKKLTPIPNTRPQRDEEPTNDIVLRDTTLGGENTNVTPLDRSLLRDSLDMQDSSMIFATSRPTRVFGTAKAASPFKQSESTFFNEYGSGTGSTSGAEGEYVGSTTSGTFGNQEYI
jgi:hypothetical protein